MRGGLTIVAGVLTGNLLGFVRVALTAYLLGTHSRADSLAVAMGPLDTLNSVLINSMVFAFVPMLTAAQRARSARRCFCKLSRCFAWVFSAVAAAVMLAAPWLMRALAPGLDPRYFGAAVNILRISGAFHPGGRRGARCIARCSTPTAASRPTAFYQAALNVFTIARRAEPVEVPGRLRLRHRLHRRRLGAAGDRLVRGARRAGHRAALPPCEVHWREILAKPAFFVVYAAGLGLNITFTRAYATHAGPGMAAALDYCMRGVGVPLALLVNPISNSLLPEIARLRSLFRLREAFRLIDRTIALAALVAVGGCGFALVFRQPAIALLFQRGSFTAESTRLVASAFLALGPSLIGWSLMEIPARSLFALDRPWPPVIAAFIPVLINVALTLRVGPFQPELLGLGASVGLMCGFAVLFVMAHTSRKRWLGQG